MLIRELILERLEDRMETLGQWWNDPTIYVSFTSLEKIGINPQSEYNTPLGVYAYPLKEMYDNIEQDKIPFAGDQPWIQVLKSTHATELSNYSDGDLATDITKLKQLFGSQIKLTYEAKTAIRSDYSEKDDQLLLKSLHSDQPFDEKERRERQATLIQQMDQDGRAFDYMVKLWSEKAFPKNRACSKFWNITRNIALDLASHKPRHRYAIGPRIPDIVMTKPESLMWNKIFRMLGYVAFSDKTGLGLIHINEPISAVFLTPSSYTHITTVKNIQKTRTPRPYSSLRELTYSLERASNDINNHRSGKLDKFAGIEVEKAYEFRNHVLADWLDALTTGNTKYIQLAGLKWQEHEAEDFPNFMKVLLSVDFNQFPVIAKFLVDNSFYRSKSYQDSVTVAKEFIAISPPSKHVKQYIDGMLGSYAGWEAAFVLGSMDDTEDNYKHEIGATIAKNIMKATGITWDKLRNYLGNNYYSLTTLIPEELLRNIA